MKEYKRHFLFVTLVFIGVLLLGLFLNNRSFGGFGYSYLEYKRPVSIDVCYQTNAVGFRGQFGSLDCNQLVNYNLNYYYYASVNSQLGQYVPYIK